MNKDLIPLPVLYFRLPYAMDTDLSSQDRKDLDKFIKFFALKVTFSPVGKCCCFLFLRKAMLTVARVTRLGFGVGLFVCFC